MHGEVCIGDAVNWGHGLNRGLLSWYLALPGQSRGVVWRDLCRRYEGTLTGGVNWGGAAGRPGGYGAWHPDGVDDYITLGIPTTTFLSTATFSLSLWFRSTGGDATRLLFSSRQTGPTSQCNLKHTSGNVLSWNVFNGTSFFAKSVSLTLSDGLWHHFLGTCSNTTVTAYLDGVEMTGTTASGAGVTGQVVLAGELTADSWGGQMDDLRIWKDRVITADEARLIFKESRQGYPSLLNWTRSPRISPVVEVAGGLSIPIAMYHYLHHLRA